ncbi:MAG TPA: DUF4340 domain-containing protein [Candidatus Limnocylindrales bacterium]|jgi:hypothetical protein|nr:DUF4340 domain-containing protein [Candidatus Limnocylindrales bacterium]
MNRNQFALLLFLLVVLGIAGLMVYNKQNEVGKSTDPAIGRKLLGDLPVNDVAHIAIKQGTNELNLVKKENLWRVRERNDYPANYSEISDFLLKAKDLKIIQSEKIGPSQLVRLDLVPGSGTNSALVVDLKDQNEKEIRSVLLGKKHLQKSKGASPFGDMGDQGWPDGRYVKVGAGSETVALISDALANIEPRPDQWLNKDFFKVEKIRSVAVEGPAVTNAWKISRDSETAEWKLADAKPTEQLDSSKTSSVGTALSSPSFTDVITSSSPEQLGLGKPTVVNLETFDDFSYTFKVGTKTNDSYPLALTVSAKVPTERAPGKDEKPEDKTRLDKEFKEKQKKLEDKLAQEKGYEKWVYLVSSWTLDPLLKDRAQLLVEKKPEPKKEEKPTASATEPLKPLDSATEPDAGGVAPQQ